MKAVRNYIEHEFDFPLHIRVKGKVRSLEDKDEISSGYSALMLEYDHDFIAEEIKREITEKLHIDHPGYKPEEAEPQLIPFVRWFKKGMA